MIANTDYILADSDYLLVNTETLDKSDEYYYTTYRLKIYPNKTQKIVIENNLKACEFAYNYVIYKCIDNIKNIYGFDYHAIPKLNDVTRDLKNIRNNYEYHTISKHNHVNKHAIDDSAKNAIYMCIKQITAFKKSPNNIKQIDKIKLKDDQNRITSYYVDGGIKYYNKNDKKLVIPSIGKVRYADSMYLPDDPSIYKSARIIKEAENRYFVSIKCYQKKADNSRYYTYEESNKMRVVIDIMSKDRVFVVSTSEEYDGSVPKVIEYTNGNINYENIRHLEKKIYTLKSVIDNKIKDNKNNNLCVERGGYSNNCKKIQDKMDRAMIKRRNMLHDYIDQFISKIIKMKPSYIVIESSKDISKLKASSYEDYDKFQNPIYKDYSYFCMKLQHKANAIDGITIKTIGNINNKVTKSKYECDIDTSDVDIDNITKNRLMVLCKENIIKQGE